jgi:anionic cell wall polymer biosynthesis LytR-Cps2A-Psr (LCP) family protein
VKKLLGMDIGYYAVIDFYAFEQFIDELGGVKIDVPEEIVVDPLGKHNTKTLKPGVQTLPGDLALAYARARNTAGSDFDRAARQQQVIMGIRDRILSKEMLTSLIERAPALYATLSDGIRTNLTLLQVVRLAWLGSQIPQENIKQGIIGPDQITFGTSYDGQDILQPVSDAIRLLRDEVFTTSGPVSPATTETDPAGRVVAENAYISILNSVRPVRV